MCHILACHRHSRVPSLSLSSSFSSLKVPQGRGSQISLSQTHTRLVFLVVCLRTNTPSLLLFFCFRVLTVICFSLVEHSSQSSTVHKHTHALTLFLPLSGELVEEAFFLLLLLLFGWWLLATLSFCLNLFQVTVSVSVFCFCTAFARVYLVSHRCYLFIYTLERTVIREREKVGREFDRIVNASLFLFRVYLPAAADVERA